MNLRVEQRALAQSDQENIVVLGPNPADESFSSVSTEGAYKILGVRPGLTISVFDMVIGADFVGRSPPNPASRSTFYSRHRAKAGCLEPRMKGFRASLTARAESILWRLRKVRSAFMTY